MLSLRKIVTVGILLSALALAGCDEGAGTVQVNNGKPLVSKIEKGKPTPLEDIVGQAPEALSSATDTTGAIETDEFLIYVDQQKERTLTELEEKSDTAADLNAFAAAFAAAFNEVVNALGEAMAGAAGQTGSSGSTTGGGTTSGGTDTGSGGDSGTTTSTAEPDNLYENADDGYSIIFPRGWQVSEGEAGDKNKVTAESEAAGDDDSFLENVSVEVEELLVETGLGDYTDSVIADLEDDLTDFDEVDRTSAEIDGRDAKKVIYTHKSGGKTIKVIMYVLTKDLKGYAIKGSAASGAYSEYEADFKDSAESFDLN